MSDAIEIDSSQERRKENNRHEELFFKIRSVHFVFDVELEAIMFMNNKVTYIWECGLHATDYLFKKRERKKQFKSKYS